MNVLIEPGFNMGRSSDWFKNLLSGSVICAVLSVCAEATIPEMIISGDSHHEVLADNIIDEEGRAQYSSLPDTAPPKPSQWYEMQSDDEASLVVPLYKSKVLKFQNEIKKVSIGNPDIADILLINPSQMYVLGKALGTTNILVLDYDDQLLTTINLEVGHDLAALKKSFARLLPGENIQVHSSQGSIVLSGEVSGIGQVKSAMDLAKSFMPLSKGLAKTQGDEKLLGNKVINLLKVAGAQQVMLEVKVAEISRQFMKSIDVDFNLVGPGSWVKVGAVSGGASMLGTSGALSSAPEVNEVLQSNLNVPDKGLFYSLLNKNALFNAVLKVAKEKGLAKVLSEPTLTTLSGQEAKFISGGEFPTPIPQSDGNTTIQFKEFGVGLKFLPVVLDQKRINLKLDLSVSELTNTNTVTVGQGNTTSQIFVPSLSKRSVNTTVELADGQTLGIAGLISDNLRSTVNKFPGLGKIPVIGALFRSQEFIKGQTELVIFVTPHFAKPSAQTVMKLPTDDYVEPSDAGFYIKGELEEGDDIPVEPMPDETSARVSYEQTVEEETLVLPPVLPMPDTSGGETAIGKAL